MKRTLKISSVKKKVEDMKSDFLAWFGYALGAGLCLLMLAGIARNDSAYPKKYPAVDSSSSVVIEPVAK